MRNRLVLSGRRLLSKLEPEILVRKSRFAQKRCSKAFLDSENLPPLLWPTILFDPGLPHSMDSRPHRQPKSYWLTHYSMIAVISDRTSFIVTSGVESL